MQSEKYDTSPRAERYLAAMCDMVRCMRGAASAAQVHERAMGEFKSLPLGLKSRLPRPALHLPGYPHVDLSDHARALAEEALRLRWFENVQQGRRAAGGSSAIESWDRAVELIMSRRWYIYHAEAIDTIKERVLLASQVMYNEMWNEVVYLIERIWGGRVEQAIAAALPVKAKVKDVTQRLVMTVRGAVVEEHWSSVVALDARPFKAAFELCRQGRFPCGPVSSYPCASMYVL